MEFLEKLLKTAELVFPALLLVFGILGLTGAIDVSETIYQIVLIVIPVLQGIVMIWAKPSVTASIERRGRRGK